MHTYTWAYKYGSLQDGVLPQLLLIMHWNCLCVVCFQGSQGEHGPKGDPGSYGIKGEKVREKEFWVLEFCVAFNALY